jgi:hypothetical protein
MTTTESTTTESVVDSYFAMWNTEDRATRLEHIAQAWTADAHYVDPLSDVTGYEGLADMVDGVRAQFPGATLERTGDIDGHHNVIRFPWQATGADGAVIVAGIDVCVLADDGRLQALAGFFG